MAAPRIICELIERFDRDSEAYRSPSYNETQTRIEFINPMFKALGWDIDNERDFAEAYKDVIHEDAIKVGGVTKAPDYCFRVGGTRKFFLEAKKPSINLSQDEAAAFQLRRYAWSAKLPLSILTDFEEFIVYDCRIRPNVNDKSSMARVISLSFKDYLNRWEEISSIFSRDAVLKGSFDKYAESSLRKHGTAEVDEAFLAEIEMWREMLARNIALRNRALTSRELNFAVQLTIDRLIFLRICEDRGVEEYGRLKTAGSGTEVYKALFQLFQLADQRYNSGLFHFRKEKERPSELDTFTPNIRVDDKPLKEIIKRLYYPESPYEFAVLPADILGHIYEQFLGKVISLTKGHQAKIEEKPEVRKSGGVYYTPTYIVDYIVKNTVGKLLEDKTAGARGTASKLRVLDPACGSGSFLIGAYQYLLNWHLEQYIKDDPKKWTRGNSATIFQDRRGEWRLTTSERKRILLNNIYGVDIDSQAVEVTKLSLLLKVLEEESSETIEMNLKLFHERALPDLGKNIKCGNSLIALDFYDGWQADLFDEEARYRINVFDWKSEFKPILKDGGFDAIIGNPPYVRQESIKEFKAYFEQNYKSHSGTADLYVYFIEKSLSLLKQDGLYSIIVSSSFLRTTYAERLRVFLSGNAALLELVDFGGLAVFLKAKDTYVCVPLFSRDSQPERINVCSVSSLEFTDLSQYVSENAYQLNSRNLCRQAWAIKRDSESNLFRKIMALGKPLGEYVGGGIFYGVKTGLNEAFVIDMSIRDKLIEKDSTSERLIKPVLGGQDIRRWLYQKKDAWLIFTRRGTDIEKYSAIKDHLSQWKRELTPKQSSNDKVGRKPGSYEWYEIQDDVAYFEIFERPKIIFPDITKEPRFCLDKERHYLTNTAYCLGTDDLYLLGILNSRLFWFTISNISIPFGVRAGRYRYRLIYQYMEKVPIRVVDPKSKSDSEKRDQIITFVERIQGLHQKKLLLKTDHDRTVLEREVESIEQEIDRVVYGLYALSDREISSIESLSIGGEQP